MEKTKKCRKCGKELPIEELSKHWKSGDGHKNVCKCCEGRRKSSAQGHIISTVVRRSVEGGVAALKGIAASDLIAELRFRGYKGRLVYSREVVV